MRGKRYIYIYVYIPAKNEPAKETPIIIDFLSYGSVLDSTISPKEGARVGIGVGDAEDGTGVGSRELGTAVGLIEGSAVGIADDG